MITRKKLILAVTAAALGLNLGGVFTPPSAEARSVVASQNSSEGYGGFEWEPPSSSRSPGHSSNDPWDFSAASPSKAIQKDDVLYLMGTKEPSAAKIKAITISAANKAYLVKNFPIQKPNTKKTFKTAKSSGTITYQKDGILLVEKVNKKTPRYTYLTKLPPGLTLSEVKTFDGEVLCRYAASSPLSGWDKPSKTIYGYINKGDKKTTEIEVFIPNDAWVQEKIRINQSRENQLKTLERQKQAAIKKANDTFKSIEQSSNLLVYRSATFYKAGYKQDYEDTKRELDNLDWSGNSSAEWELDLRKTEINYIKHEMEVEQNLIDRLKAEKAAATKKKASLNKQLAQTNLTVAKKKSLQKQLQTVTKEEKSLATQLTQANAEYKKCQKELNELQAQLEKEKAQEAKRQAQIKKQKAALQAKLKTIEAAWRSAYEQQKIEAKRHQDMIQQCYALSNSINTYDKKILAINPNARLTANEFNNLNIYISTETLIGIPNPDDFIH